MSRDPRLDDLTERVARLEQAQARANHQHDYRYSKHLHGTGTFWSWTCLDEEGEISRVCPQPSGGTNYLGGLPDHFPVDLR